MSIYPVRIKDWYVEGKPFGEHIETLKEMLTVTAPVYGCVVCGQEVPWEEGYVMHSITFGGPDGRWCSEECLNGEEPDERD